MAANLLPIPQSTLPNLAVREPDFGPKASVATLVRLVGADLDRGIYPRVLDGGAVAPSGFAFTSHLGEENDYARATSTSTGSGQGSEPTGTTGQATSLERPGCWARYETELKDVHAAYPGVHVWRAEDGMWLRTESTVVTGLQKAATFLTAFSWRYEGAKSWGFWTENAVGITWIGPRHTNFTDGTVCAFDPADGTWVFSDPIVELLDLNSVWAFRHLHLEMIGRWPGAQSVHHSYERRIEFNQNELCGCGSHRTYADCCSPLDHAKNVLSDAVSFASRFEGGIRQPPASVVRAVAHHSEPPPIHTLRWRY